MFESDNVYQDVNLIHAHFSTLSKTIEMLESCGALLHGSLENINRVTSSLNSTPGEIGENIKRKVEMVLNSNPGLNKIQSISQYLCGVRVSLPEKCSESLVPVYKYCPITSVDVERSFSAYKLILTYNRHNLSPENIERLAVEYCDASFCREQHR